MFEDITKFASIVPEFLTEIMFAIICGSLLALSQKGNDRILRLRDFSLFSIGAVFIIDTYQLYIFDIDQGNALSYSILLGSILISIGIIAAVYLSRARDVDQALSTSMMFVLSTFIGLIVGANQWLLGLLLTGTVLLLMTFLNAINSGLPSEIKPMMLKLTVRQDNEDTRQSIRLVLEQEGLQIKDFHSDRVPGGFKLTINTNQEPENIQALISSLWTIKGITEVEH